MKCHHCKKEMVPNNGWTFSCPATHAHVKMVDGKVTRYRFYLYHQPDVKFTIEQAFYTPFQGGSPVTRVYLSKHTKIPNMVRNKKNQMVRKGYLKKRTSLLRIEKAIPFTMDQDGVIEAKKLFDKLSLYVVFS